MWQKGEREAGKKKEKRTGDNERLIICSRGGDRVGNGDKNNNTY